MNHVPYCTECKHCSHPRTPKFSSCLYFENQKKIVVEGSYAHKPSWFMKSIRMPSEINKNNDCKWFVQRYKFLGIF